MRAETLKGHLDFLLLATVAVEPAHGYRIIEELKRRSGGAFDLPEGTVYPALHRLEQGGLLISAWATASGRRRRIYRVTGRGRRALARERREWRGFTTAVEAVVT
jgi:PadR family transcriptional regulator, regulatory protein PadR